MEQELDQQNGASFRVLRDLVWFVKKELIQKVKLLIYWSKSSVSPRSLVLAGCSSLWGFLSMEWGRGTGGKCGVDRDTSMMCISLALR